VEVDPDTGAVELLRYQAVDDYGRLVNPLLTEGQVQGRPWPRASAKRCWSASPTTRLGPAPQRLPHGLRLPRAADLPPLPVRFLCVPTASNPLGVKGAGQAGAIAAPHTVMLAVLDALAPLGVAELDMPATPERVWRAVQDARAGGASAPA
jgi:carbon-monoxide dehydrogenase large subunit